MPDSQKPVTKILLVEDDVTISNLYTTKLELDGYEVLQAFNGLEGVKMATMSTPDLVLIDLRMPVMDGEKFLQKFRKIDFSTPVIVLTNLSKEEAPKTLWHYGILGYFVKAHNTPKELVEIIQKTLKTA